MIIIRNITHKSDRSSTYVIQTINIPRYKSRKYEATNVQIYFKEFNRQKRQSLGKKSSQKSMTNIFKL